MRTTSIWFIIGWLFIYPWVLAHAADSTAEASPRHQPTGEEMVLDGLFARPLLLGATAVGTGIFIVTLPFSMLGGNVEEAADTLVVEPARITFGSCLGCVPYHIEPRSRQDY